MNGGLRFVPPQRAERPYTITEINQGVQAVIEAGNTLVWAEGEISNFKRASSGHCYLKLKDAQSQSQRSFGKTSPDELAFAPEDGMQVIVIATLRVYTKGGYYQLDLHKMQPAGLGALFVAFEKLKFTLEAEGLFDPARKRPLRRTRFRRSASSPRNGARQSGTSSKWRFRVHAALTSF